MELDGWGGVRHSKVWGANTMKVLSPDEVFERGI